MSDQPKKNGNKTFLKRLGLSVYLLNGLSLVCFTTSYCRQNLQNDLKPLSAFLVVLRTTFKNLSPIQDPRSRFFQGYDVSSCLFQKK
jgi:hypothetical protein